MLIERVCYVFMTVATFLISALAFFVISFFVEGVWNYYVPVSLVNNSWSSHYNDRPPGAFFAKEFN